MTENWREWEGRTIDGRFALGNYLSSSDGSGVFRTRIGDGRDAADAAIRLVALNGAEAESQLRRWQAASELRHPNLIRILAVGRSEKEGKEFVYAVEEFADENLAQIIPERALTADEVRGMLRPVLAALEFVHAKGFVHGRIRPSNILAIGDQVKLSSESVRVQGEVPKTASPYDAPKVLTAGLSPASDIWALGITVVEVLTQHVPVWNAARMTPPTVEPTVPEPLRGIAQCCLEIDPAKRCTIRDIGERLTGDRPTVVPLDTLPDAPKTATKPLGWIAAGIVGVVGILLWHHLSRGPADLQTQSPAPAAVQSAPSQASDTRAKEIQPLPEQTNSAQAPISDERKPVPPVPEKTGVAKREQQRSVTHGEIVERVTPQVSSSARRTIHGKIKVRVNAKVDAEGKVTAATLKDEGPSKYFARAALEAAQQWKFAPSSDGGVQDWTLLFAFSRARTEMSANKAH